MSLSGSKGTQSSTSRISQTTDPSVMNLLQQIMGVGSSLFGGGPAEKPMKKPGFDFGKEREFMSGGVDAGKLVTPQFAETKPAPAEGSPMLGLLSGITPTQDTFSNSLGQTDATLAGNFFDKDPGTQDFDNRMAEVEKAIAAAAGRAVGDQFSLAGRTGSPAQGLSLGKTVARELAPFHFGAAESQANRKSAAFQNERQRQLAASQMGISQFDPISQFQRFIAPLLEAASLFPKDITQTGSGKKSERGFGLNIF